MWTRCYANIFSLNLLYYQSPKPKVFKHSELNCPSGGLSPESYTWMKYLFVGKELSGLELEGHTPLSISELISFLK